MSKTVRSLLIILLAVLMVGSGTIFVVAGTHPGTAYDPGKVKLDVKLMTRDEVLTCGYKVYGDTSQDYWVGKTIIKNTGQMPVYDFKISYKIRDFCGWTSGENYPVICPGETVRDYCWPALDGEKVSKITTKTPVELIMKYEFRGIGKPIEDWKQIFLLGKNDFVFTSLTDDQRVTFADDFDNYPFLCAFITPNEPTTKSFAHMVASGFPTGTSDADALNAFYKCFDVLRAHGVKYIQESSTFWAGTEGQYVQYPKDTIDRKSGTCLDLAICVAGLMEAVGIKSYVALVPGHAIPVIELPESGDNYSIESTFIDKDFALSHYPELGLSPDVTAKECTAVSDDILQSSMAEGQLLLVDPEYWWNNGMVPPW